MGHFEILTCLKGLAFGIKVFCRILFIDPVSKFFLQKQFTEYLFCSQTSSSRIRNPKTSDQRRY